MLRQHKHGLVLPSDFCVTFEISSFPSFQVGHVMADSVRKNAEFRGGDLSHNAY